MMKYLLEIETESEEQDDNVINMIYAVLHQMEQNVWLEVYSLDEVKPKQSELKKESNIKKRE